MMQAQLFIDLEEMRGDQTLHDYIMQFLAERGIAGATSFRGYAGFGKKHKIKHPREIFSFDEPPAMILFLDEADKVLKVAKELKESFPSKLIVIHPVTRL